MKNKGIVLLLLATLILFLWGTKKQFKVNKNPSRSDQAAYMRYAKKTRALPFGYVPDRNYMPIYPWIMSWFFQDGMTDEEYFQTGKRVNIVLALLTMLPVYVVFLWKNHPFDATVALSAIIISMVAFKAPAFQPALLFFAISFFMFVSHLNLILQLSCNKAGLAGFLSGLAYLTKGAVPPLICLTTLCLVGRAVGAYVRKKRSPQSTAVNMLSWKTCLIAIAVFAATLVIAVFPYIRASKDMYGRWICENNMYFFWCDSWKDCKRLMAAVGGEEGLYRMPRSELPGPINYFRAHSLKDALVRIAEGLRRFQSEHVRWGYGYTRFVVVYAVCLLLIGYQKRQGIRAWLLNGANRWAVVYCAGFFLGYILLCAWYTYVDCSKRFGLIMFYPAMFLFVKALRAARESRVEWNLFGSRVNASAVSPIVLFLLIEYALFDFIHRIQVMDGTY